MAYFGYPYQLYFDFGFVYASKLGVCRSQGHPGVLQFGPRAGEASLRIAHYSLGGA